MGLPTKVDISAQPDPREASVQATAESATFRKAPAVRALLLYLWAHRDETLNEYRIATECLGKGPDFDPKLLNMLKDFDLNKPLPELWPQFAGLAGVPMLAIRGGNSNLLSAATRDTMPPQLPAGVSGVQVVPSSSDTESRAG